MFSGADAGHTGWYVADAFIPPESSNGILSHESLCVLNASESDATLRLTAYFPDRDPQVSAEILLPSRRAVHYRTNEPSGIGGLTIPVGVPYALALTSDVAVCTQYSRLDTTGGGYTLMTTIPFGWDTPITHSTTRTDQVHHGKSR